MPKVVTTPDWDALLNAHNLDTVAGVCALNTGPQIIKRGESSEVLRLELHGDMQSHTVIIKKYWITKPSQLWSGFWRGTFLGRSKVRREFENLARLRELGMDAPAPVAYGEERRCRWLMRSFLISECVAEPTPLDLFIRDYLPALPVEERRRTRRELIDRLADYTRRLHSHSFVHHDYFWRNIILTGKNLAHFFLIDAHKGGPWRSWAEQASRAKDLATLDAPAPHFFRRTERLRFFLRYVGQDSLTTEDKKLVRRALRIASPLRERQYRRVERAHCLTARERS